MPGIDSYTVLMCHFDGPDEGTTIVDSTGRHVNGTCVGGAALEADSYKFSPTSLYLDDDGDYVTFPQSDDFSFGTGDFTIDFWMNESTTSLQTILGMEGAEWLIINNGATTMSWYSDGDHGINYTTSSRSTGTWYHCAFVRYGNNMYYYQDGVEQTGTTDISGWGSIDPTVDLQIGRWSPWGTFGGYIDELRISKGIARWTANFTPPTSPYSNDLTYKQVIMLI